MYYLSKKEKLFGRETYMTMSHNAMYNRHERVRLLSDRIVRSLLRTCGCKRTEDHSPARILLSFVERPLNGQHQMGGAYKQFYHVSASVVDADDVLSEHQATQSTYLGVLRSNLLPGLRPYEAR